MSSKKLFSWLVVLVMMLAIVAGCKAAETELTAIEIVPQDINLLVNIQVSEIINDQDLRDAYDKAEKEPGQPQTAEEALAEVVEETGIDLRDFSEAIVFADVSALEEVEYLGIIVEGTFDDRQFIDSLEEERGEEFTSSDYKGYELYTDETEEFGIVFLTDRMLIFGTPKALKDAIDVRKGSRESVGGVILDAYNRLGDALIKLAIELPEEVRQTLTEEPGLEEAPISMESFADIDIVGFALNKEAETISIRINPHFLSTDSAQDARDTLSGAISLFKGMLQVPEIKDLLGKIEVTVTDSWVTIALKMTLSEIEELVETFQP